MDLNHYYHPYLCALDVLSWKIVYISKPIACRSLTTDIITKYLDTDIIFNYNRYYYNTEYGTNSIDISVVYPTSFYEQDNEYRMILNLNKYSLKNTIKIDHVAILEQKQEPQWDKLVREYSSALI